MSYRHRRLRPGRALAPKWLIQVPWPVSPEMAAAIKLAWKLAGREGVAVIDDRITVRRLR